MTSIRALASVTLLAAALTPIAAQTQTQPTPRVPLRTGLTIVTALNHPGEGDYESIKRFVDVNDKTARLRYSAEVQNSAGANPLAGILGGGRQGKPAANANAGKTRTVNTMRTVNRADLENATDYRWTYNEEQPESFPGSTAVGVSRKVLTALKTKGETTLRVPQPGIGGALGGLFGGVLGSSEIDAVTMMQGTLKRVEAAAVPFKVILNDQPVELMAIHARGQLGEEDAEFWILDDGDNPLALKWEVGGTRLQVIRLSYPEKIVPTTTAAAPAATTAAANAAAGTAKRIEEELAKDGRSVVYGIYFDFASDRIKEESEPVLAEIAQVLRTNPAWSLNVEGHTDNIGSDADNLDLSRRRSAAVKQALTSRYKIDGNRLQSSGYGESRPKDRNDTLEGRARNRRVELVKQ